MKISRITYLFLVFGLLISLSYAPQNVLAQGKFSYTAGIQVQNLEATPATVTLTFYKQDGTTDTTVDDTILESGSKTYFPLNDVSSGFNGAAVVSSTTKVAAVVNILGNNGFAAASYIGASQGSNTSSLPLLMKGNSGFDTWFNVQNIGTGPANITINYSDGTSSSDTIPPNGSKTYFQSTETHSQAVFSGTITSNQPIVTAAIQESSQVMFAYNGFSAGSVNPVMPLVNTNNSGYITGIQIQNVGTNPTDVTVTYTPSAAGTSCTETKTITAGSSQTFALQAFSPGTSPISGSTCVRGQRFIGSAQVTSNSANQPLVVIVNQLLPNRNGESYSGFDPAQATNKVVMPLIMDRNSGYYTGFNVMNVGSTSTTVTCTFTGTSYTVTETLNPGQALTNIQADKIANSYVGSGTCNASGSGKIVAVVNELGPSSTSDQLLVYEGINN